MSNHDFQQVIIEIPDFVMSRISCMASTEECAAIDLIARSVELCIYMKQLRPDFSISDSLQKIKLEVNLRIN